MSKPITNDEPWAPLCDWCSRPLTISQHAPHKRFCSGSCRISWHNARRKRGLAALIIQEKEKASNETDR